MSSKLGWEALTINGKAHAERLCDKIYNETQNLAKKNIYPGLAVVIVGENPASKIYVASKEKKANELGIKSFVYELPKDITEKNLIAKIENLNNDPKIHGILVQLPLPEHIDEKTIINTINPDKDVDGFNAINVGRLSVGIDGFIPCTPLGCMMLIRSVMKNLVGKKAVIIGRSNIVGKPMAQLLLRENCTVTIIHSKTVNPENEVKQADIVVAAIGKPEYIKPNWIKPGAVVIDVGINRVKTDEASKIVGDVDYNVRDIAGAITPVPGGVGPMTIACLMYNTLKATAKLRNHEIFEVL